MDLKKYESIRPLAPEEVQTAIQHLTSLEPLRAVYESLQLEQSWDELVKALSTCRSVEDFKRAASYHWVKHIMRKCCSSVELTGTDHITKDGAYTYISNHRDIILDSAFLNVLVADIDAKFPEIAIGDNLMLYPWIETLVKLNGSFLVRRNLQGREVLLAARLLSEYMHDAIAEGKSLWIAQREGRSKDSTDKTQPALLKMLALGAKSRQPLEALAPLNIVPVTCSYEYDPCDYLKAQEMQLKRDVPGFKKSAQDDVVSMQTGILGYKGYVHYQCAPCLDGFLDTLDRNTPKADLFGIIARRIDREIFLNYRFYPNNFIACDLLADSHQLEHHYTPQDRSTFEQYVEDQLSKIDLPEKDEPFLRRCLLEMYANPYKNHLSAK